MLVSLELLTTKTSSRAKPAKSVSDTPKDLFCEQLRVLSPRTGTQGAVLRSARAESTDRRVKQVLLSFWQIAARQDWPAMGPFLDLLAVL